MGVGFSSLMKSLQVKLQQQAFNRKTVHLALYWYQSGKYSVVSAVLRYQVHKAKHRALQARSKKVVEEQYFLLCESQSLQVPS